MFTKLEYADSEYAKKICETIFNFQVAAAVFGMHVFKLQQQEYA
jgi:hypothetical protein